MSRPWAVVLVALVVFLVLPEATAQAWQVLVAEPLRAGCGCSG